eukprot:TRINITY_DN7007_c0_g1_i1.p1 TRINITY_DN7007_c0_g1~~TRINITY_DN7007_c0_g1_i1.p1  ORF type:complete len:138 (-),score=42.27 TRINITY_DN7007_c0_g1_i1:63-476(-)
MLCWELQCAMARVQTSLHELKADPSDQATHRYVHEVLSMIYYWAIFSAITRGTALVMYCGLCAALAAGGLFLTAPQPRNFQIDMEAIFSQSPQEFRARVLPQLELSSIACEVPANPRLAEQCCTLRHMHEALLLEES